MISLASTVVLAAIDMSVNVVRYQKSGDEYRFFTLMDVIIFIVLTIVLAVCTVQLFMFLDKLSHTSKKEKCLIGTVCSLFTLSYISRSIYLTYEMLNIENQDCSCCL